MSAPSTDITDQIRQAIQAARQAGEPRPGRPALIKLTNATDHQVRKALATLAAEDISLPPEPHVEAETTEEPGGDLAEDTSLAAEDHQLPPAIEPEPTTLAEVASGEHQPTVPSPNGRLPRSWPLVFIGLAAAVAIWGGWVRLGELTGFGPINLLPGIGHGFTLDTAVVLPLSVEFYSAYALRVLLASDRLSASTRRFARRSFLASLLVGGGAQIASHVMAAATVTSAPWPVTTLVACVPLLVIGLATGLATLVKRDASTGGADQ
ncbi:hypothetical protein F0L68_00140 [Solihabitans fulvus]|uniref:Uncharacterized protein n=1 Tax=Solihabitans fulvus TaxID=1892852 RepID=A0A5B2XUZ9_9PSEU|nr:hypothetical protein [Solihabitans fulvus]KAA2266985.1 hypothetical protein F0L68_00140 [Solihabitans fulvus]